MMRHPLIILCAALWIMLLASCNTSRTTAPTAPARAQQPGREAAVDYGHQMVRADYHYDLDGYVEAVEIWFGDSTYRYLSAVTEAPTATPWPTFTPTATPGWPTAMPTAPATNTPRPTSTPSPTQIERTPTPEVTILPTATSTAVPKTCQLRATTTLRIRTGPGISYGIVNLWNQGETRTFDRFVNDENSYLWGHSADGWSAMYWWPSFEWWIAGTVEADVCRDVQGWPWNLAPPEPIARNLLGYHLLVGVINNVLAHLDGVSVVKGLTGSYDMALAARQINPAITVICRSLHTARGMIDGPLAWQWTAPEVYFTELIGYLPSNCDYYEFQNEWDSAPTWKVFADFEITMMGMFAQQGKCALFGSFGPGNPPYEAWKELVRVLRWIDDHPCQPGKYHGLAWHMTGHMPADVPTLTGSYIRNIHITERDQFVDAVLHANTGYSLRDFKGPIYVTEFG